MTFKAIARARLAALACALIVSAPFGIVPGSAQQAAPGATQPAPSTPAPPAAATAPAAPATPAPAAAAPSAPSPSPPAAATPATPPASPAAPTTTPPATPATPSTGAAPGPASPDAGAPSDDNSSGVALQMSAHPAAYIEGKANWTEGFSALTGAFSSVSAELARSGVTAAGRPIAVFTETDDNGFSYRAMIPIDKAPEGKTALSDSVKLGQTPAGKAMKFEHRGSYEDIDSTYEAITAYLDEKGLEADNMFVEEYLNDVKTPDDPNLQVDIYVLLK